MGLLCEFDVCADFGFIEQTEEFGIIPDYSTGCAIFCETFLSVSRSIVPVDTGYLRSTLSAQYSDTYCSAETQCEYAQYVEYGTWKQMAQPYFEPAIEQALGAAEPYWAQAQSEALAEEEELIEQREAEEQAEQERSALGQAAGAMAGAIISALIINIVREIFAFDTMNYSSSSGGSSSRSGSSGGGSVYSPEVIIT